MNSVDDCHVVLDRKPDILIDLTWVGIKDWDSRKYLLMKAECFKATTSDICEKLNIFDGFIDYRTVSHISERLALVRKFITGESSSSHHPIFPYIQISDKEKTRALVFIKKIKTGNSKILYLNGLAGQKRHCMSDIQIKAILDELAEYSDIKVLLNADLFKKFYSSKVVELPNVSFTEFSAILKNCDFIISVDTSVVHIASAFNIPVIAIFAPNDRDYYTKYAGGDVWGPIGSSSILEKFDDPDLTVHSYGVTNRKAREMNTIPPETLARRIREDMKKLYFL